MAILLAGLTLAGPATAAERGTAPPRPRLCPEDAPEGVRLPARPGCAARPSARTAGDGFRDLGNGVRVKIGGRVGADYDVRR